ncbi:phosphatidate cytidylyltransferase [Novosphingobium ginsenosidimutans]|uniref:Phosphatidate cytidylyltransferase n=1 Tax=Novosphingobium ginsenosidimutans TaxID=1176536 RepID=A0A5B8S7S2_9SPHN|nr:phosphatidate cytidylyltransferase [Novosphingobium ginsenosidimutans]QEA16737.1 phosphatidate cytidylyltransferase [Novosphingobium ginsenosidimutans]
MADGNGKNADLPVRVASAIVVVVIALTALWLGGWIWAGFAMIVAGGVLYEWRALARAWKPSPLSETLWTLGGILYLAPAAAMLMLMRDGERGFADVLTLIALVAAIDIGAYFTGRAIGGPKIAPAISPSKTWAGLLGGILGALAVLVLSAKLSEATPAWWQVLGLAVLAAIVAQAGDFFESWMKRRAGVKDSGKLIPGHGGLFDRVDGLIAVSFLAALLAGLSVL